MSATITLPLALRMRLASIRRRVRWLRTVRGLGLLVLVLGLSGAAALLADYWLDLPAVVRQVLFSVWIGVGVGLLLFGVVVPLGRRIDTAALAAVIERKYPDLGERLTSAVELAETPAAGHGSPVFIALLMDETEKHSTPLDFRPALPARRAGAFAALAAVVVFLVAVPAFVRPRQYADLSQRFLLPWYAAPVPAPYTLEVTPGDAIAARGRSVTLAAHLTPRDATVALPEVSTLVVVDADGKETRQAMERTGSGDFTIAYKVPGDVSYRIEAGEIVSESFRVTSVTPVELAAESPRITVAPPAYARAARDEETFRGLVDLSPLQHSQVRFDFRFTRPAVAARLEWMAHGQRQPAGAVSHPLTLSDDRQTAFLTLPATTEGTYRLVLEAEHGIDTILPGGTIRILPDGPPTVLKFADKEDVKAVLPYERVPLELEASDDIAVAGVELEYRVNDSEAVRQPLTQQGADTPSAVVRHVLELAGKVKENDRVSYRFHIRDNLPKEYKGPHVIVYPPDRWLTLQVARRGAPLKEREILAQRKEIDRKLDAIKEALLQEKRGAYKVRQETRTEVSLPPEQTEQLQQLQRDNRGSQKALRDVAQTADAAPALHPIAELARDVADREMSASQQALDGVPRQPSPTERTRQFDKTDEQLASAVKRLEELKKANDKLAQARLDRSKLETLADREKQLAEQAAEVAAKHPVLDPSMKPLAEKIKREQAEIAAELERLAQQSEPLKEALDQARAEETQQMSERARALAQAQRDLAKAEAEAQHRRDVDRLAELARKQRELAEQQAKLARETRQPAQAAQTPPLKPEEAQRAADALKQGDAKEADKHQTQATHDLERLAQAFERAVKVSADPKEAAQQLAQAEKALRQRVQEEIAKKDSKQSLAERLKALREEQNAIRQAAEQLSAPPNNPESNKVKRQIAERAAQAEEAIKKRDAPLAQTRMDETRNLLKRLADLLPNGEQRRQQAMREAARLRHQQEDIARQVEQIKKDDPAAAQRLEEAARRQAEVAEALSKMDAPKQEARRERTTEATNRALADLMDRRREDVPASQREARRQLERLEQALRGQKPDDEQRDKAQTAKKPGESVVRSTSAKHAIQSPRQTARLMAQEQRNLAKATQQAGPADKEAMRKLAQQQRELNRQASQLPANQAQRGLEQARAAMNRAEQALERKDANQAQQRQTEAANALERLAKQLPAETPPTARRDPSPTPSAMPRGLPRKEQAEQARQLARQQRELRDAVRRAEQKARAERPVVPDNVAGKLTRQRNLQQKAGELMRQLNRVAQQTRNAPRAQSALQRAANASQQAEQAMRQARSQAQQGQAEPERQSRERAAQALDRAAREAAQAASQTRPASVKPGSPKTGAAVAQAQQHMSRAQGQLNQGQHGQAQAAMRQAAQSLAQAAQQMTADQRQPGQPGQPRQTAGQGRLPGGMPDLSAYGLDKTPNAGKSWGELPGELRTKIVQDMKARYGEDYARMIKHYFEQIADTKRQ